MIRRYRDIEHHDVLFIETGVVSPVTDSRRDITVNSDEIAGILLSLSLVCDEQSGLGPTADNESKLPCRDGVSWTWTATRDAIYPD